METLALFKQAGIEDILNSVKNEWDNGHYLKPMAVGGGVGALGYGASSLLDRGNKDESGGDKTKRILTQMLKGTTLGAGAGAAYGGTKHLLSMLTNGVASQNKPDAASKADSEGKPDKTRWGWEGAEKGFGHLKDDASKDPVAAIGVGAGAGAGAGAGGGAALGSLSAKRDPKNSDAFRLGKETESLIGPKGKLLENYNATLDRMMKEEASAVRGTTVPFLPPDPPKFNLDDLTQRMPRAYNPQAAGESLGYLDRYIRGNPQTKGFFDSDGGDRLTASRNLVGMDEGTAFNSTTLNDGFMEGTKARTMDDLASMSGMRKAISDAELSNVARLTRKGGFYGGALGALTGGGLGVYDSMSDAVSGAGGIGSQVSGTGTLNVDPRNFAPKGK